MTTTTKYTTEEIELGQSLLQAADEGGTIQKDAMARMAHSRTELHSAMPLAAAFRALTGKSLDVEFFS